MSKTPTQNDWENRYAKLIKNRSDYPGAYRNQDGFDCTPDEMKDFIDKAVADARKEMVEKVEQEIPRYLKGGKIRNQYFAKGHNECKRDVLAILRKETK